MAKFLIAGLGNFDLEYAGTRHNIGFDVVDKLVQKHGGSFVLSRLAGVAEIKWKAKTIICIKPTTYMNLSGKAVKYWMEKDNIKIENLMVIVDDKALPLTKIRLRPGGTDGGHNGLKSVQEFLGTAEYPKLRFGIGDNFAKGMQVEHVLGKWRKEEVPLVELKIQRAVEAVESFVSIGLERTMEHYNKLEVTL
ncbi:MAG TPA: aminoacyl-tRNA hydrolase [Puia sp.]|jgi:PTH1 family peptidyl-tRNA hydrolase|nr:aminoacyl-tRNA hydrolase [Puia sp.]